MSKPATTASFVTPVVKDEEGRRLTRTMRRTDKLKDLMRFYYAMVPAVEDGKGVFLHRGRRISYKKTPADYGMGDGDEIEFFPEIEQRMFVTPVLVDVKGRRLTRTTRRTGRIQSLMDFYYDMAPTVPHDWAVFLVEGKRVRGEETLADLELEDGDEIDVVHHRPAVFFASTPIYY